MSKRRGDFEDGSAGKRGRSMIQYPKFSAVPAQRSYMVRQKMFRPIARANPQEVKTVDTTINALRFDTDSVVANSLQLLNTVPQDASPNGRVGKKITTVGLQLRLYMASASATVTARGRVLLIWVRTPNQAATLPAWTEILASQSSQAMSNRDGASKFKIVRSWNYEFVGNSTTPSTGKELQILDEYVKLPGKQCVWTNTGTAGTIAQFEKGALLLGTVGNAAYGATITPLLTGFTRFYFKDE